MFSNKDRPGSLRNQYILLTIIMGVLVIGVALWMYSNMHNDRAYVSEEVRFIDAQLEKINAVRKNLINLQYSVDNYLLDPTHAGLESNIKDSIGDSIEQIRLFRSLELENHQHVHGSDHVISDLRQLKNVIDEIIATRIDVQRQYPGMSLSAFEMTAIQDVVHTHLMILIEEIEGDDFEPVSEKLYPLVLKTKTAWTSLVSQMRIYLANRLASFSTEILLSQAESVREISQVLNAYLSELKQLYANEPDTFDGQASLQAIAENVNQWLVKFDDMRKLSESPQWRQDWNLMESRLIPLSKSINHMLSILEMNIRAEERAANEVLEKNTDNMFLLLALIISAMVFLVVATTVSMNILVFRPLQTISSALRAKALGQEVPNISIRPSRETQSLIEAFEEMDHRVNERENALKHQTFHDVLTSLPNRIMLNEILEYSASNARRSHSGFSLLYLDLDNFNSINESLGHQIADKLLIAVSERLTLQVRDADTCARIGADEFAIILNDTARDNAASVASVILEILSAPYVIEGHTITTCASMGIATFPHDADRPQLLLQYAHIAMKYAKNRRLGFAYYDAKNDEHNINKLELTRDLRAALEDNALELHFQPQVDVRARKVIGAEALLRWKHANHGFIRPDKIIELADQSGLINELTFWVIDHALLSCKKWHDRGHEINISINLAVQNLNYPNLVEKITSYISKHQLKPAHVLLEITENGMMTNPGRSIEILNQLHEAGLKLSIDDFGTGFSSLSYLQKLPVDEVKIDKSFVMNMDNNKGDKAIVESVIDLGHNLDLTVVAEGIETNKAFLSLSRLQCDIAQGYLISKPLSSVNFEQWLADNRYFKNDLFLEKFNE